MTENALDSTPADVITLADVKADKRVFVMHAKLSKGGSLYVYRGERFPRLELHLNREHSHAATTRNYYVDGWQCQDQEEIVRRLNGPVLPPPTATPDERQIKTQLGEAIARAHLDEQLMNPADVRKEFARELKERWRVYLAQIIRGRMDVNKAARRIAMFERLEEEWAKKASQNTLFPEG